MPKTAFVLRHLAFEDLGAFGPVLADHGYAVRRHEAGVGDLPMEAALGADLLMVLGGPIGAYEEAVYPFLTDEIRLLERRLAAGRPTLGICLGAQLMARALGARVYPGPRKEIGFAPLALTAEGQNSCLAALGAEPVLHWHGDTFDLPPGTVRLASTEVCRNQAFAAGPAILATQFHPEGPGDGFERWLIGHAAELAQAGIDIPALRRQHRDLGPALDRRAVACLEAWLSQLPPAPDR